MTKKEENTPVDLNKKGITIPWKTITIVVGIVLASGSWSTILANFVITPAQPTKKSEEIQKIKDNNEADHKVFKEEITKHETVITKIGEKLDVIYQVQIYDIGSRGAHIIADRIKDVKQREITYDFLLRKNISRLRNGNEVCTAIDCDG